MSANEKTKDLPYRPHKSVAAALVIFIIDTLLMNQGALSVVLVIIITFWWLPRTIIYLIRKLSVREPLYKIGIYSITAVLALSYNVINNQIAQGRAEELVRNINQYHNDRGAYPETLQDLVPDYAEAVPVAKYTLFFGEFWYLNHDERVWLFYTDLPPFGRRPDLEAHLVVGEPAPLEGLALLRTEGGR